MKKRVRVDTFILIGVIILGFFVCVYLHAFTNNVFLDDFLDLLGFLVILKGVYLRMAARGFKKAYSKSGQGLVISGPYTLTRNPMYLGSFLLGVGFILIVWPWWFLPIFACAFYVRFNKQMCKEEAHLKGLFGKGYEEYMKKVPRIFPRFGAMMRVKVKEAFPVEYLWITKEKWGLFGWPLLAALLDCFQEKIVFGTTDILKTASLLFLAVSIFTLSMFVEYSRG